MTEQEQNIINWLSFAMSLPIAYRGELCYYDKQFNLFGIIAENDHVLFEEGFRTKYVSQYTDLEIVFIKSVFERFYTHQQDFVSITRISNDERVSIQMEFLAALQSHVDFNVMIDLVTLQNDNTPFVLHYLFNNEPRLSSLLDPWTTHMLDAMLYKVKDFIKLWEIDLTTVQLWEIETSRRIIVEAINPKVVEPAGAKKPFWKLW